MTEISARKILLIKYFVILSHSSLIYSITYIFYHAQAVESTALNIPGRMGLSLLGVLRAAFPTEIWKVLNAR